MDKTLFVIVLLAGVCVTFTSSSYTYILVKRNSTWDYAADYCTEKYISFVTIKDGIFNERLQSFWKYTGKVWIGLLESPSKWTWLNGESALSFNWGSLQPDNVLSDLCVAITDTGEWYNHNCLKLKQSVCSNGSHFTIESERSWMDAAINCMDKNSTLVEISDKFTNAEIAKLLSKETEVWIGLNGSLNWVWWDTEEVSTFLNWREGQPDNLKGDEFCVAMQMDDGTWSDEPCNMSYPFICKMGS
ncbi:C-type mannose receptor 2-like [Leuresthes tenuis]|uniref:C-type mannose receptor 2-like n=1 Tax=Leuresthes tenuis TaxID=355514 RepID=UPI003B50029D